MCNAVARASGRSTANAPVIMWNVRVTAPTPMLSRARVAVRC
jgi:hypothetical protein